MTFLQNKLCIYTCSMTSSDHNLTRDFKKYEKELEYILSKVFSLIIKYVSFESNVNLLRMLWNTIGIF